MKKKLLVVFICSVLLTMTACSSGANTSAGAGEVKDTHEEVSVKTSPDKYTWYVKDYVGKNVASLGYTSMGGDRMDSYGEGLLKLVLVNESGKYIDISNEDELKKYVVVAQNVKPNTEIKYTFETDENGKEYDGLTDSQTVEEVVLFVKEVGTSGGADVSLTEIKPATDKYTYYVRDYVGRNLAYCGYTSMGGDRIDKYGAAAVKLVLVSDDGSYVDIEDKDNVKNYVVKKQNIAPNTEIKFEREKDENGKEYSFAKNQNIDEIELHLASIKE